MMEKLQTLRYHNEILLNTSVYKYVLLVKNERVSDVIKDVIFNNFIESTKGLLKDDDEETLKRYRGEMEKPYHEYIGRTISSGWQAIKNNLLTASFISFGGFLDHLVTVYYKNFPNLYANDDISVSFTVIEDLRGSGRLKEYFVKTHAEQFAARPFDEKILYIKKTLKLSEDDIWIQNGREPLRDIAKVSGRQSPVADEEYYDHINYLCRLIYKLSAWSQKKYDIEFDWIAGMGKYLAIEDKRQ